MIAGIDTITLGDLLVYGPYALGALIILPVAWKLTRGLYKGAKAIEAAPRRPVSFVALLVSLFTTPIAVDSLFSSGETGAGIGAGLAGLTVAIISLWGLSSPN